MKSDRFFGILIPLLLLFTAGCNIPVGPGGVIIPAAATPTGNLPFPPTITPSLTPAKLTPTVSTATYCRSGPGTVYDQLATLPVGVPAEVIGQNRYHDTWVIKFPGSPTLTCWLWGQYATRCARTAVNKARAAFDANSPETKEAVLLAISELDKAANQGVIHKNNAARRKSRLMKKLASLKSE